MRERRNIGENEDDDFRVIDTKQIARDADRHDEGHDDAARARSRR